MHNGIIISVEHVCDAFSTITTSDTANGFGENTPTGSCEYNVHCKLIIS
jgi:hypothetical protein